MNSLPILVIGVVRICGLLRSLNDKLIDYSLAQDGSSAQLTAQSEYLGVRDELQSVAKELEEGAHRIKLTDRNGLVLIKKDGIYIGANISVESSLYRKSSTEIAYCHSQPSGCSKGAKLELFANPPSST